MYLFEILLFVILISFTLAALSIAPFVPTRKNDLPRIHALAELKPGQVFFEMGFWDSRVCRYIAKNNPKATVIGIDMCFPLYVIAKVWLVLSPIKNLQIQFGDGFSQDLKNVDVVYVFWVPDSMKWLQKKFEKSLKKGAKIISYVCEMKEWKGKVTKHKPDTDTLSLNVHIK